MTALDQAFIKAYKQPGPAGRPAQAEDKTPAPGPNVDAAQIEAQIASTVTKLNDLMAALEKPAGKFSETAAADDAQSQIPQSGKDKGQVLSFPPPNAAQPSKSRAGQKRKKKTPPAPTLDGLDVPEAVYRLDPPSPTVPDAPRGAAFASALSREKSPPENSSGIPAVGAAQSVSAPGPAQGGQVNSFAAEAEKTRRFDAPQGDTLTEQSTVLSAKGFYPESAIRVFQPMLQVDHFAWPKVCQRLESVAALELARLAETLVAAAKQGMKVIGLGGGQRGEGATTMLLCAARQLVARNLKIALVDADLGQPQLAKRLGLLPQLGWEDVAAGRQPVEEVLVESSADNIAVLPLCGPLAISGISFASQRIMAESLEMLRKNYDLVLLDLGPLEIPQSLGDLASGGLNCRIDAVSIVHKAGKVLATCLPAVRQSLAAAAVAVIGVIENFVPNAPIPQSDS